MIRFNPYCIAICLCALALSSTSLRAQEKIVAYIPNRVDLKSFSGTIDYDVHEPKSLLIAIAETYQSIRAEPAKSIDNIAVLWFRHPDVNNSQEPAANILQKANRNEIRRPLPLHGA